MVLVEISVFITKAAWIDISRRNTSMRVLYLCDSQGGGGITDQVQLHGENQLTCQFVHFSKRLQRTQTVCWDELLFIYGWLLLYHALLYISC